MDLKIKYNADGTIKQCKARPIVLGIHQVKGADYNETFARVARMVIVRCILTLSIAKGWGLH